MKDAYTFFIDQQPRTYRYFKYTRKLIHKWYVVEIIRAFLEFLDYKWNCLELGRGFGKDENFRTEEANGLFIRIY